MSWLLALFVFFPLGLALGIAFTVAVFWPEIHDDRHRREIREDSADAP